MATPYYAPPQTPPPSAGYPFPGPKSGYQYTPTPLDSPAISPSPPASPLPVPGTPGETLRFLETPGPRPPLSPFSDTDKKHLSSYSAYSQFSQFSAPDNPDRKTLWAKRARLWVQLIILASFVAAMIVMVLHHIFLRSLDGKFISEYKTTDREWIGRMSNIFGRAVVTLLRIVVVTTLVQAAWTAITMEYTPIAVIDDLFQLPSPLSALSLFRRSPKFRMLWLVTLSALSLALALVGTLAPTALIVATPWITGNLTVPILDITQAVVNPDLAVLDDQIRHSLLNNISIEWTLPPQCQSACWFELEYAAPGLDCRYMGSNETALALTEYDEELYAEGQDWTFYRSTQGPSVKWGTNNAPLNFSLIPFDADYSGDTFEPTNVTLNGPVQGQFCEYIDRTYRANFTYINNIKAVNTRVVSDTNTYSQSCTWRNSETLTSDCVHYADGAGNIANGYSVLFNGTGTWNHTGVVASWNQYFTRNLLLFNNDSRKDTLSLATPPFFGDAVEKGFSNAVLTILLIANLSSISNNSSQLAVEDWGGGVGHILDASIWSFKPVLLWEVYGIALVLVAIAGIYGLYCARKSVSDIVREKHFSSFFIATRTKDLDVICSQHADIFMTSSLKHDPQTGRFMVLKTGKMKKRMSVKGFQTMYDETKTNRWPRTIMILCFIGAIALALGHHFFLNYLDGRHALLQTWVKAASNAFAYAVAAALAVSATYSLTQATWRALQVHGGTIEDLDNMFNLPSVAPILLLLRKARGRHLIYVVIIAVMIEALALITVFAPNALTIDSIWRNKWITVPTADLGGGFLGGSSDRFRSVWTDHTAQSLSQPPEVKWTPPPVDCGESCSFSFTYEAPALACRDLRPDEYTVTAYNPTTTAANGSWLVYDWKFADDSAGANGKTYDPMPFTLDYVPMTSQSNAVGAPTVNADPPMGSYCECTDGTYELGFNLTSNAIMLNTTLLSYGNGFSKNCTGANAASMSDSQRDACFNYRDNAVIICNAFASAFQGQISLNMVNGSLMENVRRPAVMKRLVDMSASTTDANTGQAFLQPAAYPGTNNLTTFLPGMFGNLTTSLLPDLNTTRSTFARVKDSGQRWIYTPYTLVYVYVPSLALVLGVMAYAIYCIRANGKRVMESDFSTFLTTTRNAQMDEVYDSANNFRDLLTKKIVFSQDGLFVAADQDGNNPAGYANGQNGTQNQTQTQHQNHNLLSPTEVKSPTEYKSPADFQYPSGPQSPNPYQYPIRPQSRPTSVIKEV